MKQFIICFTIIVLSCSLAAKDLSLYDCYDKAEKIHPLQIEWQNRQVIYELNQKNLNITWLPSLNAHANATYISDVVEFDKVLGALQMNIPPGTFPTMPKDQYKITIDVNQTIYDGGAVSARKKVARATLQADWQSIQSEFYKVRDKVNQVYFALLILEKQSELTEIYKDEILQRRATLQSGLKNGINLPSNVDILDAELLKIEQKIAELVLQQGKARDILSELIGENADDVVISLPSVQMSVKSEIRRPEIGLFEKEKITLEMNKKIAQSQRLPKAVFFGTYGYGQPPGSDFFETSFGTYYIVGTTVSWNIFDWNATKRTKETLQAQQNIVNAKEENFKKQVQIALKDSKAEIDRAKMLLDGDAKLIILREKIKNAAVSKLNNGTISSTEFLSELNAEREARINYEMHKIQYVQAQVKYLTISGQIKNQE